MHLLFTKRWSASALVVVALAAGSLTAAAQEKASQWPQFLGPHRNGISAETGLMKSWPEGGPKEVWRVAGGVGMSGIAVRDGIATTLVQKRGKQFVVALDAKTGKTKWETPVAGQYRNQMGNGPRATPTMTGERIFVFTGQGVLAALESDGKVAWSREVVKDLGGKPADYGMACSPLVVGENVVVTAGAPRGTIVAYNRKTGKPAWKLVTGRPDTAGYSSPALLDVGGKKQVVAFTGKAAVGVDPQTGNELWRHPYVTDYDCNIATPIAVGERVFISAGENHGSALLKLEPREGAFEVSTVWTSQGGGSVMRNEWQTSILLGDYLYGMDNVGSAGPVTNLRCIEAATGKPVWAEMRFGKGNLIAADGKLFIATMKGELAVVRPTPEGFEEMGRTKPILGRTRQAPSLAGGLLYLRDDREIVCLDVR